MKKILLLAVSLLAAVPACNAAPTGGTLSMDANRQIIQGFAPNPNKVIVPINLSGTKVFKKGSGGDYDITGWLAICITPSTTNLTRYFNSDTTKTRTVFAGQDNIIILSDPHITQITISGTDARVEVEGM